MPDPAPSVRTWRAVLEAHSLLVRLFEDELQQACGVPLAWYDVLVHLAEAPGRSLRMRELADSLLLSRSWLTRRIEGLEAAGLVERGPASDDGRGVCATLTPAGLRAYRRAERVHSASMADHFLDQLTEPEAAAVEVAMTRIAAHARDALDGVVVL